jgi:putative oxidoreductase
VKKIIQSGWLEVLFRVVLGTTFAYASIHKIIYPDQLAKIIYGYQIMPGWAVNLQSIFMPWMELSAGFALLLGLKIRGAAVIIAGMLFAFICAISFNLIRGLEFDCGCFSFHHEKKTNPIELLIRDVFLFAMTIWVFFSPLSYRKLTVSKTDS